jgi:hypothetical protein
MYMLPFSQSPLFKSLLFFFLIYKKQEERMKVEERKDGADACTRYV